jgi:hypothetical protein
MASSGNSAVVTALAMFQGEAKTFVDTVYDGTGAAQNITGWSIEFIVHEYNNPDAVLITKTTANGGVTLTTPASGVFSVVFTEADTLSLFPGQKQFYARRTDAGQVAELSRGPFTILRKSGT